MHSWHGTGRDRCADRRGADHKGALLPNTSTQHPIRQLVLKLSSWLAVGTICVISWIRILACVHRCADLVLKTGL